MKKPDLAELARIIRASAHMAYTLSLGHYSGGGKYHLFKNPKPGDLVMELSTGYNDDAQHSLNSLGYLERVTHEDVPGYEGEDEEDIPQELAWYIRRLDGKEARWVNADFIKVPSSQQWARML